MIGCIWAAFIHSDFHEPHYIRSSQLQYRVLQFFALFPRNLASPALAMASFGKSVYEFRAFLHSDYHEHATREDPYQRSRNPNARTQLMLPNPKVSAKARLRTGRNMSSYLLQLVFTSCFSRCRRDCQSKHAIGPTNAPNLPQPPPPLNLVTRVHNLW